MRLFFFFFFCLFFFLLLLFLPATQPPDFLPSYSQGLTKESRHSLPYTEEPEGFRFFPLASIQAGTWRGSANQMLLTMNLSLETQSQRSCRIYSLSWHMAAAEFRTEVLVPTCRQSSMSPGAIALAHGLLPNFPWFIPIFQVWFSRLLVDSVSFMIFCFPNTLTGINHLLPSQLMLYSSYLIENPNPAVFIIMT